MERAYLLIQQAEALAEAPEDTLLLFSVLYGAWTSNYVAANGTAVLDLSAQFLALAEKQGAMVPLLIAHRIMGISLAFAGDIAKSRLHFDRAFAFYDPAEHRLLAARFSVDSAVSIFSYRSWVGWFLGHPQAALADANQAISDARQLGQAATLMYALWHTSVTQAKCGNYVKASAQLEEAMAPSGRKRIRSLEGVSNSEPRLRVCLDGRCIEGDSSYHDRDHRISVKGTEKYASDVLAMVGMGLCKTRLLR